MDDRIVQFISGLRAAGVRVSLAESQDAAFATGHIGITDRAPFQVALRATLIKEHSDEAIFDALFPLYFGHGAPPMLPATETLSEEQQALLREALRALAGELSELLRGMLEGEGPSEEQVEAAAQKARANRSTNPTHQPYLTRQMLRKLGLEELLKEIEQLLQKLSELGMNEEGLEQLRELLEANIDSLSEQVMQQVGQSIAERLADATQRPPERARLSERPFQALSAADAHLLRHEVARLAVRLRTRAALRQKRGKGSALDVKATIRANIRNGGVPFDLCRKRRRRKPKLVLICDVSTSMRPVVEYLLGLLYEVQDQVGRTRSFAFIDHMEEVSAAFEHYQAEVAVPMVLRQLAPGYYSTDLGTSLKQFFNKFLDSVDGRTTIVICGDGRNNYNNPRFELVESLQRRSRRVLWFNPEPPRQWGTGDSDMNAYAPLVDSVHQVNNLRQLAEAVDRIFVI